MKIIYYQLLILLFIALATPPSGYSQDGTAEELHFEVNKIYPPISIEQEQLKEATTILDLNKHYKSAWIKDYISVEILTTQEGAIRKVISKNDQLSQEQKDLMNKADLGTDIAVKVQYIPENTLKQKESKEINFKFTVSPEKEAEYIGGPQELKQYLKENAIDEMPDNSFQNYDLAIIKFTVNEEGAVMDAHIYEPLYRNPKDEKIDKFLLETICSMPNWKPAEYANGKKVKQEFALTVGNHKSCVINLLNINPDGLATERY